MNLLINNKDSIIYRCEICKKVHIIKSNELSKFKFISDNVCILNDNEQLICDQCGNIHNSDNPMYFYDENSIVKCPKCGSTQIQLMKRGWKITTGLLNSSKIERVCMRCKHKF